MKIVYETIEQPLVPVLYRMERTGVLVDRELLQGAERANWRRACWSCRRRRTPRRAGRSTWIRRKQLQEILFGKLGTAGDAQDPDRPAVDRRGRARGTRRTRIALPKLILEYRGVAKLKSTYTDKLP